MKVFTGTVIATKMAKTATVALTRVVAHPVYKKPVKKTRKYQVHDEIGVKVGDSVHFVACAPISKSKKWKILNVVGSKAQEKIEAPVKKVEAKKTTSKKTAKKGAK